MSPLERFIAFFLPLGLGLYLLISNYFGIDLSLIPGDLGDTRFNIFLLEHCHQYFTGTVEEFWNAGFMYPEEEVITLSDNLLGSAPIYSALRMLGLDIFTAFQGWAIALSVLNYTCAYLLVSHLSKKTWFAGVAAFVFAFSIGLAAQMNHAQTFPRFAIPLAFLFLLLWRERGHWKWFFWAFLSLTYTFYCGIYLGFMNLIPFSILFIFIVIENWSLIKRQLLNIKTLFFYGLTLIINLLLLFKLFIPYLRRAQFNELHSYEQIKHSIPTPESYISAHPGSLVHQPLEDLIGTEQIAHWDHWLFSGWLAIIGLFVMFILTFNKKALENSVFSGRSTWLILITGTITFFLFLRVGDYSLYYYIQLLPGFGAMRSMTRIINIELLFFGIGLAVTLTHFAKKVENYKVFVFIFVLLLLVVDNSIYPESAVTTPKKEMHIRHHNLISKMKNIPKGSIVSYEPDVNLLTNNISHYQLDAMLAAQSLRLKSINGYSARAVYLFDKYWAHPNPKTRKTWLERFPNKKVKKIYVIK